MDVTFHVKTVENSLMKFLMQVAQGNPFPQARYNHPTDAKIGTIKFWTMSQFMHACCS